MLSLSLSVCLSVYLSVSVSLPTSACFPAFLNLLSRFVYLHHLSASRRDRKNAGPGCWRSVEAERKCAEKIRGRENEMRIQCRGESFSRLLLHLYFISNLTFSYTRSFPAVPLSLSLLLSCISILCNDGHVYFLRLRVFNYVYLSSDLFGTTSKKHTHGGTM